MKKTVHIVERKPIWIILPFLGRYSLVTKRKLLILFRHTLPMCNLRVMFRSSKRLSHFFSFKVKIPLKLWSHNVYHFTCTGCNSCYIGLAERHTYVRWCDHLGVSWRSGQPIVGVQTEIKSHIATCKTSCDFDNFKVLTGDSDVMRLKIKESLLIKKDGPNLNKNVYSTPLYLFWIYWLSAHIYLLYSSLFAMFNLLIYFLQSPFLHVKYVSLVKFITCAAFIIVTLALISIHLGICIFAILFI